jgi:hypothetical protein
MLHKLAVYRQWSGSTVRPTSEEAIEEIINGMMCQDLPLPEIVRHCNNGTIFCNPFLGKLIKGKNPSRIRGFWLKVLFSN